MWVHVAQNRQMIDQPALIFKCLVNNNSAYPRTKSPNERKTIVPDALCCLRMFVDDNYPEEISRAE